MDTRLLRALVASARPRYSIVMGYLDYSELIAVIRGYNAAQRELWGMKSENWRWCICVFHGGAGVSLRAQMEKDYRGVVVSSRRGVRWIPERSWELAARSYSRGTEPIRAELVVVGTRLRAERVLQGLATIAPLMSPDVRLLVIDAHRGAGRTLYNGLLKQGWTGLLWGQRLGLLSRHEEAA